MSLKHLRVQHSSMVSFTSEGAAKLNGVIYEGYLQICL